MKWIKIAKFNCVKLRRLFFSILYAPQKTIPNKIVFDNFNGKGYGDNPGYIAESLSKLGNYDMVWLVEAEDVELPRFIRRVKNNTPAAFYEYSTAGVWIDNVRNTIRPFKRKNQTYIQTWHASYGVKKVEGEAKSLLDEEYIMYAQEDGKICDYILADSFSSEQLYKQHFWLNPHTQILKCGLPRNDILFNTERYESIVLKIKEKFKVENDTKMILYAPTFRDDLSTDAYELDFNDIINAFQKKYDEKYVVLVRLHPNVSNYCDAIKYSNNVINVTSYPSIQELAIAADILITDYSSSYYDFLIQRKPVFLCALDRSKYEKQRGLVQEYDELPFPYASSCDNLIENIKAFDTKTYLIKVDSYLNRKPVYDKGDAAYQVASFIKKIVDKAELLEN